MLNADGDLHRKLEQHSKGLAEKVALFMAGKHYVPYLPSLVSGEFDADRADFVLRDALMSGVQATYDLTWLVHSLTFAFHPVQKDQLIIAIIGTRGTHTLEQFLRVRDTLYKRVYKHKTVRAAEKLVESFLRRLRYLAREGKTPLDRRRPFDAAIGKLLAGESLSCTEVLELDDFRLWSLILDAATAAKGDSTLRRLARMLTGRDFPKLVRDPKRDVSEALSERDAKETVNRIVGTAVGGDPEYFWFEEQIPLKLFDRDARNGCWVLTRLDERRESVLHLRDLPGLRGAGGVEVEPRLYVPGRALTEIRAALRI